MARKQQLKPLKKGQSIRGTYFDIPCGTRDESGVAACKFAAYLVDYGLVNPRVPRSKDALALDADVHIRVIYRIFEVDDDGRSKQDVVSLGTVDRILMARDHDVAELTMKGVLKVIPYKSWPDALSMALYENLDDDDCLQVEWDDVQDRAVELLADREIEVG